MGVIDTAKMINKARQAKKKMEQVEAVGKDGFVAILINGLYEINDLEVDLDSFKAKFDNLDESTAQEIVNEFKKSVVSAMKDAKKQLEKELASMTSLDDLKGLFG